MGYLIADMSGWKSYERFYTLPTPCAKPEILFPEAGNTVWCFVGNGGMDPYSSPYIIPNN